MSNVSITNGFPELSDANLEKRTEEIIASMTANQPAFPTPDPSLATVQSVLTAFSNAVLASRNGDRVQQAFKKQKKAELVTLLHRLGEYVLYTVKGDRAVAISSGFHIGKDREPSPPLVKPVATLSDGVTAGELRTAIKRVPAPAPTCTNTAPTPRWPKAVGKARAARGKNWCLKTLKWASATTYGW